MSKCWPLCATRMSSPTKSRNAGQTSVEGRLVADVGVVPAVHLARPAADRPVGAHQLLELLHHHPAPHPDRGDLDDLAVGDLLVRGLEIERDVVLERVRHLPAVVQLERLEEGERPDAAGRKHEVAGKRTVAGQRAAARRRRARPGAGGTVAISTPRSGSTQIAPPRGPRRRSAPPARRRRETPPDRSAPPRAPPAGCGTSRSAGTSSSSTSGRRASRGCGPAPRDSRRGR